MEIDAIVIRYCLLFLFATFTPVNCGGTLYVTLQRYQNDTCGGYVQTGDGTCVYTVSLTIQSYIFRGSDLVEKTDHYQLLSSHGTEEFRSKQYLIKFSALTSLGPVPNPIPIELIKGTINFTFAVNNSIVCYNCGRVVEFDSRKIFEKTYAFTADSIKPYSVTQHYELDSTGTLSLSTNLKCAPRFAGMGCQECEEGWYGVRCEVKCEQNVNYTCQPVTGKKLCREDYYGDECERHCKNTTLYTCTEYGNKLCVYPAVGSDCASSTTCPEHKYGAACNITCRPVPGHFLCGEDGARVCEGHFAGPDCSSCTEHHYGARCNVTCEPRAPLYTCSASGERVCADMGFGEQCEVFCNTSAHNYNCTIHGNKICKGNWVTKNPANKCDSCREHFYGPHCQVYCKVTNSDYTEKCKKNGEKKCRPRLNRAGEDCTSCIKDHYPVADPYPGEDPRACRKCVETDRYTCISNGTRSPRNCKATWYGEECDKKCEDTERYSCHDSGAKLCKATFTNCADHFRHAADCRYRASVGYCDSDSGYYNWMVNNCARSCGFCDGDEMDCGYCVANHYGEFCEVECLETTISECDPKTGAIKCKPGYYGLPSCEVFCNISSPLYDCTPHGEKECRGNRDRATECETCVENWYGDSCDTFCVTDLFNKECAQDGSLVCKQGWAGEECLECATHWYGSTCSEDDWWTGTCSKTCDTFCVDLSDYKCNSEGVLEMTPEFAALWYPENEYYGVKVAGIVIGFFLVYLFATFLMYKIAFVWYPAEESK